jgi:thymidylate synthase (FAD)
MNVQLVTTTEGRGPLQGKSIDDMLVYIARVSSSREDNEKFQEPEKLINYCWRNGHVSIFESVNLGFEIETDLMVSHQIVRHRSAVFQQFSRRYSDEEVTFEPTELRLRGSSNRQGSLNETLDGSINTLVEDHIQRSKELYEYLLGHNIAAECARRVLPVATTTKLYMTNNVRNWIFYLQQRTNSHAQKEHRLVAEEIKKIFVQELPIVSKGVFQ